MISSEKTTETKGFESGVRLCRFKSLPKSDNLSKKLSLLLITVTEIVSVASLKMTSALYWRFLMQRSLLETTLELSTK